MDNTSTTIQARLEAVQAKQAEWQQEFDAVREDARQECLRLCKLFNFTTSDLELEASGKKTAKKATKLPPKFKNPEGEETWTGRGGHKPHPCSRSVLQIAGVSTAPEQCSSALPPAAQTPAKLQSRMACSCESSVP